MSWLAGIIADIAEILVEKLGGDILQYFRDKAAQNAAEHFAQQEAQASIAPLEAAQTPKEVDDAAKTAFDNT